MTDDNAVPATVEHTTESDGTSTTHAIAEVQAHLAEAILGLQKLGGDAGTTGLVATSGGSCGAHSC